MDLVTPGIGMIFWSTLFFLVLLVILGKFAWPAIRTAVQARNDSIRKALESAEKAKREMEQLQSNNKKILAEAKAERDELIGEARDVKEKIIIEAKEKAAEESAKMIKRAKDAIENEKMTAITEMKKQVALLSVEIAEKVLKMNLSEDKEQIELARKLADEIDMN